MKTVNIMKRIKSFLLSGVIAFSSFSFTMISASAIDNGENASLKSEPIVQLVDGEEYILVSEETYTDETGMKHTHRSYIKNTALPYDLTRNELSIYETHKFTSSEIDWAEIWIKGTFAYYPEAKTCFVHSPSSGYNVLHGYAEVVETNQDCKYNQGGTLSKKYAYIERTLTLDSGTWQGKHTFSFRVTVNSDGNISRTY